MSTELYDPPYNIALLPQPLSRADGKIYATTVYGFRGSKKRKRHEVATGIDGESINIYNVRSQELVTSYALPPHSYLCCPPLSVLHKHLDSGKALRRTFAILKENDDHSKRRLLCFNEEVWNKTQGDSQKPYISKTEHRLRDVSSILNLDVVRQSQDSAFQIIITYASGRIVILSDELQHKHEFADYHPGQGAAVLEYAKLVDMENLPNGILGGRHDVLAAFQGRSGLDSADVDYILQMQIVRKGRSHIFNLLCFRTLDNHMSTKWRRNVQCLVEQGLPSLMNTKGDNSVYELHPSSGKLYRFMYPKVAIYDISGSVCKTVIELGSYSEPIDSFMRISASSVLTLSKGSAVLYETSYGSIQANFPLGLVGLEVYDPSERQKQDSGGGISADSTDFVTYLRDIGLIVMLKGNELDGLNLGQALMQSGNLGLRKIRLVDVVGKGDLKDKKSLDKSAKTNEKFEQWKIKVDAMVDTEQTEALETLILHDGKDARRKARKSSPSGRALDKENRTFMDQKYDPLQVDSRKANHVLRAMFARHQDPNDQPQVGIRSIKILEWLAQSGMLSPSNMEKALARPIAPGTIMTAIRQVASDFSSMRTLLALPVHWEVTDLVQALKLIMQSSSLTGEDTGTTTSRPELTSDGPIAYVNGALAAAEQNPVLAKATLRHKQTDWTQTMVIVLARLHRFPLPDVKNALRAMLSLDELMDLIENVLQSELQDCGWTSRYVKTRDEDTGDNDKDDVWIGEDPDFPKPGEKAIRMIGDLLNCAVDAIGISGWLVGLSAGIGPTERWLDNLRAQISVGLESCYEAQFLGSWISEVAGHARPDMAREQNSRKRKFTEDWETTTLEEKANCQLPLERGLTATRVAGADGAAQDKRLLLSYRKARRQKAARYSLDKIRV